MSGTIFCPRCHAPQYYLPRGERVRFTCPGCRDEIEYIQFPALELPGVPGEPPVAAVEGQEAGCYFHPEYKAEQICAHCGRFICSLCDLPVGEARYCPVCLEAKHQGPGLDLLVDRRTCHDNLVLKILLASVFLFLIPSLFLAPLCLFLVIRYWQSPGSLLRRGRWRLIAALVLSSLLIIGWVLVLILMVLAIRNVFASLPT